MIVSHYFSNNAFAPIAEIIRKSKKIGKNNLHLRLQIKESKGELFDLAKTFNEMLDRLENSVDAQKYVVSSISHELKTPLTRLVGELELAIQEKKTNKEYKEVLDILSKDIQKLVKLTNSLLDLAKVSYDNLEISFNPIRVDEILLDVKYQLQNQNSEYKIQINFDTEIENESQISVYGNEYLLKIAFINLIENGCKFSSFPQSKVIISTAFKKVKLSFIDWGIGISDNDLDSIFIPFYRGGNKYYAEGNGIGLALTKRIINLHSGNITIDTELQKGTTFTLELPTIND